MAGALVNQMATGLIPIYTQEAGTDCGGFGHELSEFTHSVVRDTIKRLSKTDPEDLKQAAVGVSDFAVHYYSQANFRSSFKSMLSEILREG